MHQILGTGEHQMSQDAYIVANKLDTTPICKEVSDSIIYFDLELPNNWHSESVDVLLELETTPCEPKSTCVVTKSCITLCGKCPIIHGEIHSSITISDCISAGKKVCNEEDMVKPVDESAGTKSIERTAFKQKLEPFVDGVITHAIDSSAERMDVNQSEAPKEGETENKQQKSSGESSQDKPSGKDQNIQSPRDRRMSADRTTGVSRLSKVPKASTGSKLSGERTPDRMYANASSAERMDVKQSETPEVEETENKQQKSSGESSQDKPSGKDQTIQSPRDRRMSADRTAGVSRLSKVPKASTGSKLSGEITPDRMYANASSAERMDINQSETPEVEETENKQQKSPGESSQDTPSGKDQNIQSPRDRRMSADRTAGVSRLSKVPKASTGSKLSGERTPDRMSQGSQFSNISKSSVGERYPGRTFPRHPNIITSKLPLSSQHKRPQGKQSTSPSIGSPRGRMLSTPNRNTTKSVSPKDDALKGKKEAIEKDDNVSPRSLDEESNLTNSSTVVQGSDGNSEDEYLHIQTEPSEIDVVTQDIQSNLFTIISAIEMVSSIETTLSEETTLSQETTLSKETTLLQETTLLSKPPQETTEKIKKETIEINLTAAQSVEKEEKSEILKLTDNIKKLAEALTLQRNAMKDLNDSPESIPWCLFQEMISLHKVLGTSIEKIVDKTIGTKTSGKDCCHIKQCISFKNEKLKEKYQQLHKDIKNLTFLTADVFSFPGSHGMANVPNQKNLNEYKKDVQKCLEEMSVIKIYLDNLSTKENAAEKRDEDHTSSTKHFFPCDFLRNLFSCAICNDLSKESPHQFPIKSQKPRDISPETGSKMNRKYNKPTEKREDFKVQSPVGAKLTPESREVRGFHPQESLSSTSSKTNRSLPYQASQTSLPPEDVLFERQKFARLKKREYTVAHVNVDNCANWLQFVSLNPSTFEEKHCEIPKKTHSGYSFNYCKETFCNQIPFALLNTRGIKNKSQILLKEKNKDDIIKMCALDNLSHTMLAKSEDSIDILYKSTEVPFPFQALLESNHPPNFQTNFSVAHAELHHQARVCETCQTVLPTVCAVCEQNRRAMEAQQSISASVEQRHTNNQQQCSELPYEVSNVTVYSVEEKKSFARSLTSVSSPGSQEQLSIISTQLNEETHQPANKIQSIRESDNPYEYYDFDAYKSDVVDQDSIDLYYKPSAKSLPPCQECWEGARKPATHTSSAAVDTKVHKTRSKRLPTKISSSVLPYTPSIQSLPKDHMEKYYKQESHHKEVRTEQNVPTFFLHVSPSCNRSTLDILKSGGCKLPTVYMWEKLPWNIPEYNMHCMSVVQYFATKYWPLMCNDIGMNFQKGGNTKPSFLNNVPLLDNNSVESDKPYNSRISPHGHKELQEPYSKISEIEIKFLNKNRSKVSIPYAPDDSDDNETDDERSDMNCSYLSEDDRAYGNNNIRNTDEVNPYYRCSFSYHLHSESEEFSSSTIEVRNIYERKTERNIKAIDQVVRSNREMPNEVDFEVKSNSIVTVPSFVSLSRVCNTNKYPKKSSEGVHKKSALKQTSGRPPHMCSCREIFANKPTETFQEASVCHLKATQFIGNQTKENNLLQIGANMKNSEKSRSINITQPEEKTKERKALLKIKLSKAGSVALKKSIVPTQINETVTAYIRRTNKSSTASQRVGWPTTETESKPHYDNELSVKKHLVTFEFKKESENLKRGFLNKEKKLSVVDSKLMTSSSVTEKKFKLHNLSDTKAEKYPKCWKSKPDTQTSETSDNGFWALAQVREHENGTNTLEILQVLGQEPDNYTLTDVGNTKISSTKN